MQTIECLGCGRMMSPQLHEIHSEWCEQKANAARNRLEMFKLRRLRSQMLRAGVKLEVGEGNHDPRLTAREVPQISPGLYKVGKRFQ